WDYTLLGELFRRNEYTSKGGELESEYGEVIDEFCQSGDPSSVESASASEWYARRCLGKGLINRALVFAQYACSLNPVRTEAIRLQAVILADMGQYAEAQKAFLRAHQISPVLNLWYSDFVYMLKYTGQLNLVLELISRQYENPPAGMSIIDALGEYIQALLLCGDFEKAERLQRDLISRQEGFVAEDLVILSRILAHQGRLDDARSILKQSPHFSENRELMAEYANTFARNGDVDIAEKLLESFFAPEES
ncbi:hypothetical protein ACFQ6V_27025, partial [Streptomyces roseifaciens]